MPAFLRAAKVLASASSSTISGFDSTGADLLILEIDGASTLTNTATVSDTQGNTWTKLTVRGNNSNQQQSTFYCLAPTTNASHNFTQTGATFSTFKVSAWSGVGAFDQEVGRGNGVAPNVSPGTVTPSVNGCLILCLACSRTAGSVTIDSGFTIADQNPFVSGVNCGNGTAYLVQSTAAAVTPSWSAAMEGNLVVFTPAAVHNVGTATGSGTAAGVGASTTRGVGTATGVGAAEAISPITGALYRFTSPINHDNLTSGGTMQGIGVDPAGGRFWVSVSGGLFIYNGSWGFIASRFTTSDSPTSKTQLTNMAYDGTTLFVSANNFPNTTPRSGWVIEYNPTTLARITEHLLPAAHYCEGVFIRNGEFWTCYHDWPYVSRFDASWTHIDDYPLPGAISDQVTNLFQGGAWSGNYLYLVVHNNNNPTTYWVYLWDDGAETFTLIESRKTPFTEGLFCGQGLAFDEPHGKMYFAQRNGLGAGNIVETTLSPSPAPVNIGNGWTLLDSVQASKSTGLQEIVLNTTGADLIVLSCMASTATVTFTDQFGNTVAGTPIANTTTTTIRLFVAYIKPTVTGIGHRFTANSGTFETFTGAAFSGSAASPLDVSASAATATQAGSITPTANGDLILAFLSTRSASATFSIDSGFTISDQTPYLSSFYDGGAIAYLTQTTAAAINPAWSDSGTVGIVAFKRGTGVIANVGTATGHGTASAIPAPGGVTTSSGTATGSSTVIGINALAPAATKLVSSSTPAWVTDFGDSWNSLFPLAMNTYTHALWTYHTAGTSGLVTDPHDYGAVITGTWTSDIDYTDVSGIASVFLEFSATGPEAAKAITGATNATPIVLTIPAHGLTTDDEIEVSSVGGNTNANGRALATVIDANTVSLRHLFGGPIPGNGAYTSGGTASRWVWSRSAGLQAKASARWARVRFTTTDTAVVNSLGHLRCSAVSRAEKSTAFLTSLVSGGVLVQLAGTYIAAQSVVVTTYGSGFIMGLADRILVAPDTGLFFTTTHSGTGNLYTYQRYSALARTILADDYLEYDVYIVASTAPTTTNLGGAEINFTDGTPGRSLGLVDQSGLSMAGFSGGVRGAWVHRRISLAAAAGKTALSWDVVCESDVNGTHSAIYRNLQINDASGALRATLWADGEPTANATDYQVGATNVQLGPANSFLAYAFNASNAQVAVPISWEFNGV